MSSAIYHSAGNIVQRLRWGCTEGLLYDDDLALVSESLANLNVKLEAGEGALELKINIKRILKRHKWWLMVTNWER